jgi:acyl-CoA thioesterase
MVSPAQKIVEEMMLQDAFSQWLGIRVVMVQPGSCQLQMQVTPGMCNGFGIAHGGIAFALCDSGSSFAVNAYGRKSMSVDNNINQCKAIQMGDVLNCYVKEVSLGKKLGIYSAEVVNQEETLVAVFRGTYYRSDKRWFDENENPTNNIESRIA